MAGKTNNRESFLARVKAAASSAVQGKGPAPPRTQEEPGRSISDATLSERFATSAVAAGIVVHKVAGRSMVADVIASILQTHGITTAITWSGGFVPEFGLSDFLERYGVELIPWNSEEREADRKDAAFGMTCGITGADYAVAETGSLVILASPSQGRSVSLLGEVHVAIVLASRILPDLYDIPGQLVKDFPERLPSNVTLITGPSKTADIELQIVIGVHGPRHVYAVLVEEA